MNPANSRFADRYLHHVRHQYVSYFGHEKSRRSVPSGFYDTQNLLSLCADDFQIGVVHQHVILVVALGFAQAQADLVGIFVAPDIHPSQIHFAEAIEAAAALDVAVGQGLVVAGGAVELVAQDNDPVGNVFLCNGRTLFRGLL